MYGPCDCAPVRSKDGTTLITDQDQILKRWAKHFETVLNQPAVFDDTVLNEIPQWTEAAYLDQLPNEQEVLRATCYQADVFWEVSR